jgi:hypothetical protein
MRSYSDRSNQRKNAPSCPRAKGTGLRSITPGGRRGSEGPKKKRRMPHDHKTSTGTCTEERMPTGHFYFALTDSDILLEEKENKW